MDNSLISFFSLLLILLILQVVRFSPFFILCLFLSFPQKSRVTKISSFGSSAILDLIRSAAFRPLLTGGLALSGFPNFQLVGVS